MAISRLENRIFIENTHLQYEDYRIDRNVRSITHYNTPELAYPSLSQVAGLEKITRIWSLGDKLWKYANEYYGSSKLWWVLAWYNQKPTESHFKYGDKIYIPLPLDKALFALGL